MGDFSTLPDELPSTRLILRRPRPSDAPAVARITNDWHVVKMTASWPWPYPPGAPRTFVRKFAKPSPRGATYLLWFGTWVVGSVGTGISPRMPEPEIGYIIGREYWRRGFAGEGARAIIDAVFGKTDTKTIQATYMLENPASGRVLHRLGFGETRTIRRWSRARMQSIPCREGVLTRSRWEARNG